MTHFLQVQFLGFSLMLIDLLASKVLWLQVNNVYFAPCGTLLKQSMPGFLVPPTYAYPPKSLSSGSYIDVYSWTLLLLL